MLKLVRIQGSFVFSNRDNFPFEEISGGIHGYFKILKLWEMDAASIQWAEDSSVPNCIPPEPTLQEK